MADGMVRLELTFWHKGKVPGDIVEVRPEEVRSWHGFAKIIKDDPAPTPEPALADDTTAAAPKTTTASKAK